MASGAGTPPPDAHRGPPPSEESRQRLRFRAAGVSGASEVSLPGQVGQATLGDLGLWIKVSCTKIKFI